MLVARTVPTVDGVRVAFDDVWSRRRALEVAAGVAIAVPALDDLILTKRFGGRPKDLEDIRLLEALRKEERVKAWRPPTPEALAPVRRSAERQLSPEEVRAALAVPLGEAEEEESRSLIRWFRRRYPTPADRLAYARRAYRRWTAAGPRP